MICVSIGHIAFKDLMAQISDFEMIELRLDLLDFSDEEYQQIFSLNKPVIATYRYGETNDAERIASLQKAISLGANYVDIEIDADKEFIDTMMNFAKENNCKTILSYHNFKETPNLKDLNSIIAQSKKLKADYTKIACMAQSTEDVARMLSLYEKNKNLIAFNMGEIGKISRLASLFLGADFAYASISENKKTASGQIHYKTFNKLFLNINE